MKSIISLLIACSLLLAGCGKTPDVDELTQQFSQHQTQFKQLAKMSCEVKASLNTTFHHHKINAPLDDYPEHIANQLQKINTLLKDIDAEAISLSQKGEPECSLFITQWSVWFYGEGAYMGYSYQPAKISDYNPAIHQEDKRDPKAPLHFTKALADGWYIEYVNIP